MFAFKVFQEMGLPEVFLVLCAVLLWCCAALPRLAHDLVSVMK